MLQAEDLFDLSDFQHRELFPADRYVWVALDRLKGYMDGLTYPVYDRSLIPDATPLTTSIVIHEGQVFSGVDCTISFGDTTKGELEVRRYSKILEGAAVIMAGATLIGEKISIGKGVLIEAGALIKSPAVIGDFSEVRQGAYLRGYCLTGKRCVLGHTTEIKHSIFLNDAKAGHFAYLGDSILGTNANLGAGTKFANLKMVSGNVFIRHDGKQIDTGRRKLGAILGDRSQTGCNSVTNPGTIFGKQCLLMPNTTSTSGYHEERSLIR